MKTHLKTFLLIVISLMATAGLSAQEPFFFTKNGLKMTLAEKDGKGKINGYTQSTVVSVEGEPANCTVVYKTMVMDNKKKPLLKEEMDMKIYIKDGVVTFDPASLAGRLMEALKEARRNDVYAGFTSVGPHRDDYKIIINGRDARAFASQGQQRTAALSLKLAEIEVMRDETREAPILLLDDVMSELDVSRRRMLLSRIGDVQTLITCTHLDDLGGAKYDKAISIHEGKLTDSVDKILQN